MPPKKNQENSKTKAAKRTQSAADKTFGLKNKNKSSRVQSYVKQVEAQVESANSAANKRREAEAARRAAEKKAAELAAAQTRELFKTTLTQKVPFGVDPKSVVCVFFKNNQCSKGAKCKFSHDLEIERKSAKRDLYQDTREQDKKADTMDDWDEEKLRQVALSKHGNPKTTTDIVCKYFIEAVENSKYGWFWTCPNGGDKCKYKHSLPPGFVLKTKEQRRLEREAANKEQISLDDFIETERHRLPEKLTPVTLETFTAWKKQRLEKKLAEEKADRDRRAKAKVMSGRELLASGSFVEEDDDEDNDWDFTALRDRTLEIESNNDETTYSFNRDIEVS